jgi:DNA primase
MHEKRLGRRERFPRHWSISTSTGLHNCFSCSYGGSLVTLVMDVTGASMWDATRRIQGYALHLLSPEMQPEEQAPGPPQEVLEAYESLATPPDRALRRRRITREAAELYGLRWDDGAWVIPIRNVNGGLMGWQLKGVDWVRNRPSGVSKAQALFGMDLADTDQRIVVMESPLDVVYVRTLGIQAVALYGSKVSHYQHSMLELFDTIVWALDNDEAGQSETRRILGSPWHGKKLQYVLNYDHTKAKDPGEMDPDQFLNALATAHWPGWH